MRRLGYTMLYGALWLACCSEDPLPVTPPGPLDEGMEQVQDDAPPDLKPDFGEITRVLKVSVERARMRVGERQLVSVRFEPKAVSLRAEELEWKVEPEGRVRRQGFELEALSPGEVVVRVCVEQLCAQERVEIEPNVAKAVKLELEPSELLMISLQEQRLRLRVLGEEGEELEPPQPVEWTSSEEQVVGVFEGELYARAEGEAVVTARLGELEASSQVSVRYLDHLKVSPPSGWVLVAGAKPQLQVEALSQDGLVLAEPPAAQVSFRSAHPEVADFSTTRPGELVAKQPGEVRVEASWEGLSQSVTYSVELKWRSVDCGSLACCGIAQHGDTYCWGTNRGVLGQGASSFYPVLIDTPVELMQVSATAFNACGLDAQGQAWCWGHNARGMVGDGTTQRRDAPVVVDTTQRFETLRVSIGGNTCGLTLQGELYCWGTFPAGTWNMKRPSKPKGSFQRLRPELMTTELIQDFSLGINLCARRAADGVWMCQGENRWGQLGNGTDVETNEFVDVPGSSVFEQLVTGGRQSCALDAQGAVWCWGTNVGEILGQPLPMPNNSLEALQFFLPTPVAWNQTYDVLLDEVSFSVCGVSFGRGVIECWGENATCLLNQNPDQVPFSYLPMFVAEPNYLQIDMGGWSACFVTPERDIACWGSPSHGPRPQPDFMCQPGITQLQSSPP